VRWCGVRFVWFCGDRGYVLPDTCKSGLLAASSAASSAISSYLDSG
jgi:hypothetical protein